MNKMNRRVGVLAALLVAVLVVGLGAGCGDNGGGTAATQPPQTTAGPTGSTPTTSVTVSQPIKLNMVSSSPTTQEATFILLKEWAQRIEQETAGKVQITVLVAGTLCGQLEIFDAVLGGIADIANGPAGWAPARFGTSSLAGNYLHRLPNAEVATAMIREIVENTSELQSEWAGLKVLWINGQTPGQLHLVKRADSMTDLKGRQIRMPGDLGPWGTALGVVPVSMPTGDIYMALQKGIIDGAFSGPLELEKLRLAEVTPFTLDFPVVSGTFVSVIPVEKWNSLPDDVKAVIETVSAWAGSEIAGRWDQQSVAAIEWAKTQGHEMIEPTADEAKKMLDALYGANKTVAASFEKDGRPGMAVLHAAEQAEKKYVDQLLFPDYHYSE